ncbi:methylated-DNA--[protein]-cysteine S-methyltransferase [Phenylobacterium sp.]|uniref:methylated-DNA--[protein]-cysteine S-methyltransferase n=1 Tax=Phenylobacterium sp. TaxID=1871053 RepID=UPI00122A3498|nr:methylated-DNA--[protein]-cysteine S-methyltransferase [Phenylobacterium sp.]THD62366.1 MAG: methylated-DNA--[protein]-cysteine S-methyltransferase [Phenylobacterium sp.]
MTQYALFETAIGWAGLAWGADGLVAAHLPDATPEIARKSFTRRFPEIVEGSPPAYVLDAIDRIRALMLGKPADLTGVPIEMGRVPDFNAQVYAIARAIPPGETLTYGQIAEKLGDKLLARDVGAALGQNPWPIVVPCHRVTAAGGKLGGFSARGGVNTKARLLAIEGAKALEPPPPKPARTRAAAQAPQPSLFD